MFQCMSKGRNTLDNLLNVYAGKRDAVLCLDANVDRSRELISRSLHRAQLVIMCLTSAVSDPNMVSVK